MSLLLSQIENLTQLRALPEDQLPALCAELRQEIISICGHVGGHLGASLGAVELVVALHRVFKSPVDRLVFDVGHQAYAHKILTGRRAQMSTLRQAGGIAPFLDPRESPHDAFAAGHACTAVSAALGILEGKRAQRQPGTAVAILGDGALTGGLTFEGLANAGSWPSPLVVVLNDNQMSISKNVGAVSRMLRGAGARHFFESLGFSYLGPLDGHNLDELIRAFRQARQSGLPVLVHALTEKGRGFPEAEADARTKGHAMGPYELRDGKLVRSRAGHKTYSEAFAEALEEAMVRDPKVVAVTPAMLEGSALTGLAAKFPNRVFDVGIAEQHAVTFSAGLAASGLRPVCLLYSTFFQRAYDSLVHDVCLTQQKVVFALDRAGLVGADGATHQGAYDISFMRPLPGMKVMAPVWEEDVAPLLTHALSQNGPTAIRFPRGTLPPPKRGTGYIIASEAPATLAGGEKIIPSPFSRWLKRVENPALSILTLGPLALAALDAAHEEPWNVLDAVFAAPLDEAAVLEAGACGPVLVVEEGTVKGGLGSAVLELFSERNVSSRVLRLGIPDRFVPHGDARVQRSEFGLDAAGISRAARELLG